MARRLAFILKVRGGCGLGVRIGVVCHAQSLASSLYCSVKPSAIGQGQMKGAW